MKSLPLTEEAKKLREKEMTHLQWSKLIPTWVMLGCFFVISLLRGDGDGAIAGVIKCSGVDWFLFSLILLIAFTMTVVGILIVRKDINEKKKVGLLPMKGDLNIDAVKIGKLLFFAFISAFFSAGLGVDLGLILAPALLHCGMDPM